MATAVETTKTFMNVLNSYSLDNSLVGRVALDEAVRTSTTYANLYEAVEDLKKKLADTTTYPDTNTRLQEVTGMIIGAKDDYEVDTGAISGSNAGGSVVKNSHGIVPEEGILSEAIMPSPGTTTPVTYTGEDGNSFTFYVKWPDSFSTVVNGIGSTQDNMESRLDDSRYQVDLNTLDPDGYYTYTATVTNELEDGTVETATETAISNTYGQMKNSMQLILKGLNTWWLREGAKLNYDSLGLALDGQTIEIKFVAGGSVETAQAITYGRRKDSYPSDFITLAVNINNFGLMDDNDNSGLARYTEGGKVICYLDRVIAHEMVHAVMFATGTLKEDMPQFFTEGIADVVQGNDDYNSGNSEYAAIFVNNPDALAEALVYTPGTGNAASYPAGTMLMRFLAKQNLNTTMIIADENQAQTFDYYGNNEVITNFTEDDAINYNASFTEAGISGTQNDFVASAKDGNELILRDVRGQLMTLNTSSGTSYAYMANGSTEIDGRTLGDGYEYDIIFGTNYENDIIRAGDGGSYLWGGHRGNDELFGGAGEDTFIYEPDGGKDTIHDAESQDIVRFRGIVLDDLSSANFVPSGVAIGFKDGGSLNIEGQPSTFVFESDTQTVTYRADYQNQTFSEI